MNMLFYQIIYFFISIAGIFIVIRLLFGMRFNRGDQPKNKTCVLWAITLSVMFALIIVAFGHIDQWQYVKSESELLRKVVVTVAIDPEKLEIKGLNHAEIMNFKNGYALIVTPIKTSPSPTLKILRRHSTFIKYSNGKCFLITNKSHCPPYYLHPFFVMPKFYDSSMSFEDVHAGIFTEWPSSSFYKITEIY